MNKKLSTNPTFFRFRFDVGKVGGKTTCLFETR